MFLWIIVGILYFLFNAYYWNLFINVFKGDKRFKEYTLFGKIFAITFSLFCFPSFLIIMIFCACFIVSDFIKEHIYKN
jgi:uncharacterized membrane protein YjgN (DUF898 family)